MNYFHIPGLKDFVIMKQLSKLNTIESIELRIVKQKMNDPQVKKKLDVDNPEQLLQLLKTRSRLRPLPFIKTIIYYFVHEIHPNFGCISMGRRFNRDHSTVLVGKTEYMNRVKTNKKVFSQHLEFCHSFGIKNKLQLILK